MNPNDTKTLIENSDENSFTVVGTTTSDLGTEEHVGVNDDYRRMHVFNAGPTGAGKTEVIKNVAMQDIHKDRGVCLLIPAGDAIDDVLTKIPEDREDDVVYINPNESPVSSLNVLRPHITDGMTQAQLENQKELIVSDVVDLFRRNSTGEWGTRYAHHLKTFVRAFLELNIQHDTGHTLEDVYEAVVDEDARRDLIDRTTNPRVRSQLVHIHEELTQRELGPIQWRLEIIVQNETVRRVVAGDGPSVDFHEVVNDGKILLVDLKREHVGPEAARIIGSVVATQIWAAAQSRVALPAEERVPFYLLIDEAHMFGGDGSSFAKILAEARKYGLGLWLSSQFVEQMEPEMRRAVKNNCRTKLFFDQKGAEEKREVASMLAGMDVQTLTNLGEYRAALQTPGSDEAVVIDTLPPWPGDREPDEVERLKVAGTVAEGDTREKLVERRRRDVLGPGANAGDVKHQQLLEAAVTYLESRPEVEQVNLLYQETGMDLPDGEVSYTGGDVANLEAEMSTIDTPAKVLRNVQRAAVVERDLIIVVDEGDVARLDGILADPVNRRGDDHEDEQGSFSYYADDGEPFTEIDVVDAVDVRVLVYSEESGKVRERGQEPECPELDGDSDRSELEAFCLYRSEDGICELLDQPCVLTDTEG